MSVLGCFLFVWLITGLVWFFQTSPDDCDPGLYEGSKWYFILSLIVPLCFCCCLSCCMFALIAAQSRAPPQEAGGFQNAYP